MDNCLPATRSTRARFWDFEKRDFLPLPGPPVGGIGLRPRPSGLLGKKVEEEEGID
jgi:hypothetical protein